MTYAVVAAIFAEYAGAELGLGIYMQSAKNSFRTDLVLAAVIICALLTLALYALTFALQLIDPGPAPEFVLLDAGAGLALWVVLAVAGWLTLERFIADPPLGRGRS